MVDPIPPGYHTVTPYLLLEDVGAFLDFAEAALGAEVTERTTTPDGGVMHAEIRIGDSRVMAGAARPEWPAMPTMLYLYVPDCDAAWEHAVAHGATGVEKPRNEFYGDRSGGVKDPFGNLWWFGTHVEDVSSEEIQRRMAEMGKGG